MTKRTGRRTAVLVTGALLLVLAPPAEAARGGVTSIVGMGDTGLQGNGESGKPSISADGYFVAFESYACNLLTEPIPPATCSPDDTNSDNNAFPDIFVRERNTDNDEFFDENEDPAATSTVLISKSTSGAQANAGSFTPSISDSGRYVAFASDATNLVPDDTNNATDVFVHDRDTSTTTRVSVRSSGAQGENGRASHSPAISPDGSRVAFASDARLTPNPNGDGNNATDVYVRDLQDGTTIRVSVQPGGGEANGASYEPAISDFGSSIAFTSCASNLSLGDTNGKCDVFVRRPNASPPTTDVMSAIPKQFGVMVEYGNNHSGRPPTGADERARYVSISPDGELVAFGSLATNLVFKDPTGLLPADTNAFSDVYLRDVLGTAMRLISVTVNGDAGNGVSASPVVSGSLFPSCHTLPDPVGYQCVPEPQVKEPSVVVAFSSTATNLRSDGTVPDTDSREDVFVRDLAGGQTDPVTLDSVGIAANSNSWRPTISRDARFVVFYSEATNLVTGDLNGRFDVFARDRNQCAIGFPESGPLASEVHNAEGALGPAGPVAHDLNCQIEQSLIKDIW